MKKTAAHGGRRFIPPIVRSKRLGDRSRVPHQLASTSSPDPSATTAPPLSEAASTPFAQVSHFLSRFLIWFATEADTEASGSTSTEDQASYASASFAAPFPDAQPIG
ncbi:hypothetical protein ZIOFF_063165 [Zingiber officinale]|uniref:Uncharacterized protein n=1 Tax=Zingiber officinale TaxID=94328 RepID=A0A8J5K9N7_ZINOF|nr:hypothetical protein ZIOFF_063165 [Zingiber officinale]